MVERSAHGSVVAETPPPRASLMLAHGFTVEQLVKSLRARSPFAGDLRRALANGLNCTGKGAG
jgi:hypothetical protein